MSEQSIYDKSVVIRNETQEYANTRGRVADILDDINETKANKEDVNTAITAILNELDITEADIINYVNQQNNLQDVEIAKKVSAPTFNGNYILVKTALGSTWKALLMNQNQMPFWNNGTFENSPVFVVGGRIGIGEGAPTESLHVNGSVRADTYVINPTTANTVPNKMWSDGSALWFTNGSGVNKKFAFDENGVNIPQVRITTTSNITTETKSNNNLSQSGKNVVIDNGANNINLIVNAFAGGNFCATYIKDGTGAVTIVAGSGVTLDLVQYADVINGKSGSRFMISQNGSTNTFKIFVRNYE